MERNDIAEQPKSTAGPRNPDVPTLRRKMSGALRWFVLWCLLLAMLAALRSHTFYADQGPDEAVFLYGGQAWAAGQLPYRDFWDHKPPNIFLFHSVPLRLFPFTRPAVLIHELLWLALAATLLAAVCRLHFSRVATFFPLLFFCFFISARATIRSGGLTEESSLAFVALSYLMLLRPSARLVRDVFVAGLSLGMAAQFRQTYALSLIFLALAVWRRSREGALQPKATWAAIAMGAIGFVLPELFWSAYFALRGAWKEYFEASYLFNFFYVAAKSESRIALADSLNRHWQIVRETGPPLAAPLLAVALSLWMSRKMRWLLLLLIVAFVCEFFSTSISGEYYGHYYVQAAVSSCLLLGLAADTIYQIIARVFRGPSSGRAKTAWLAGSVAAGLLVIAAAGWLTHSATRTYLGDYRRTVRRSHEPDGSLATQKALGVALARLAERDERILLLGDQPNACYFAARRYAGSRYFHNSPIFKSKFQQRITPPLQQRMLADLEAKRPIIILLGELEDRGLYGLEMLEKRPGAAFLRSYLKQNYVALDQIAAIPKDWFWYNQVCTLLVRMDAVETVRQRCQNPVNPVNPVQ